MKLKQQLQGLIVQPPTQSGSFTQRCYPSVCLSVRLFVYLPPVCRLQRVLLQAAGAYRVGQSDSSDLLSPMHSGKLHSLVEFSFPLCIKPATTGSATKLAVVAGSSQSGYTLMSRSINAMSVIGRKPATNCNESRRFLTVKNRRQPLPVVAARRLFSAQRKTELN